MILSITLICQKKEQKEVMEMIVRSGIDAKRLKVVVKGG